MTRHRSGGSCEICRRAPATTAEPQPLPRSLGIAEIDHALDPAESRGIIANALHEVRVETGLAAARRRWLCPGSGPDNGKGSLVFRKGAGSSQTTRTLPVFWISDDYTRAEYGGFYGPGLAVFGLRADNLIRIRPKDRREALWAAGEIAATAKCRRLLS